MSDTSKPKTTETTNNSPERPTLQSLVLSQNYIAEVGVKKHITTVQVKKPSRHTWFQLSADENWRVQIAALVLKDENETFLVAPTMHHELAGEWVPLLLVGAMTLHGSFFLLPIKLPGVDGTIDSWNASARDILDRFAGRWIRRAANKEAGAYDVFTTQSEPDPPVWPEETPPARTTTSSPRTSSAAWPGTASS